MIITSDNLFPSIRHTKIIDLYLYGVEVLGRSVFVSQLAWRYDA